MPTTTSTISGPTAVTLYVGALVGPSLLALPGLVVQLAGPAAMLAWAGLLVLSALIAWVFAALGVRHPTVGGTADYAAAALGPRAARLTRWWFVAGVVLGAPVVCFVGAGYVSAALGGGRWTTLAIAAALLVLVLLVTVRGRSVGGRTQLVLVGALLALVLLAVLAAAPHADADHWRPFLPHGWSAVLAATAPLMLCFVGWEAIAPLVGRLAAPARQLPRVVAAAWATTAVLYLGLGAAVVAVLGDEVGLAPLADLLAVGVGRLGPALAAVVAVVVTLAATNAYLAGAGHMLEAAGARRGRLPIGVGVAGLVTFGALALGVDVDVVLTMPTVMFVAVYVVSGIAALQLLRGPVRVAAAAVTVATTAVLVSSGWVLIGAGLVALLALRPRRGHHPEVVTAA